MSLTIDQLYELFPAIYRIRDAEQGEPLKALISVIAEQVGILEEDIARLYENWFIETCDEWVVPYIGDLLGVRGLHPPGTGAPFSQRALIANALRYRRRKGTATVLEQLAYDSTGYRARAVEFFELLEATQHFNHPRLTCVRTPDLRRTNELELIDTAFDIAAHTVDVRNIKLARGRHNIPNIGLYIWRVQSYFLPQSTARALATPGDGRYTFNPLGQDAPLFNRPQTETEITHLAEEINVPGLLRRRPLYDELESRRQALVDGKTPVSSYFSKQPPFHIFVRNLPGDQIVEIPPEEIVICNLSDPPVAVPGIWLRPATTMMYAPASGGPDQPRIIQVAADPVLGRLAFPIGVTPNEVRVSYAYGFSGDVGGGPYDRKQSVVDTLKGEVEWQVGVSQEVPPVPGKIFATVAEAIAEWNLQPPGCIGVIAIMENATFTENLTGTNRIKIPEGSQLLIVAADWPETPALDGSGQLLRVTGRVKPLERRAHLLGNIAASGTAPEDSQSPGELALNGLLIEGKLTVDAAFNGNLGTLRITHCTLVPNQGGLSVTSRNAQLRIYLDRSICGPVVVPKSVPQIHIEESIIDGDSSHAISAAGTILEIEKATILGKTSVLQMEAGNSIFTEPLIAIRRQTGCVRFSYLPDGSKTPRRFRCQPDLALENAKPGEKKSIRVRIVPSFTSEQYGEYAYCQLSRTCATEITTGAEDGSEMGVFSFLRQPQRLANLQTGLDEYLKFGLEAGIVLVT